MKPILFQFDAQGKAKALREVAKLFERAGTQVVTSEAAPTMSKRAGVSFRNVDFTFADGQRVTMAVKETGDVFEVRINGSVVPLRNQDDPALAVKEIAGLLDKRRAAFQKAQARVKVPLPPSLRVSRKTLMAAKVAKRDALKEAVTEAEKELADLTAAAPAA